MFFSKDIHKENSRIQSIIQAVDLKKGLDHNFGHLRVPV